MRTSENIFIDFGRGYRKEFGENASDKEIAEAFGQLINALRVIDRRFLDERFEPSSCLGNHSNRFNSATTKNPLH
jgi:hypothetical protein